MLRWWRRGRESSTKGLPLHDALEQKKPLEVIEQILLEDPTSVKRKDKDNSNRLPLHTAINNEAPRDVVELLINKYAKALRVPDVVGDLPLHDAAQSASVEVVELLMNRYAKALEVPNKSGRLPLHFAAQYANVDVVQVLINKYAKALEVPSKYGWLPLHLAAQHAPVEVVQLLINGYAKALEVPNNLGALPLHRAVQFATVEVVQLLMNGYAKALEVPDQHGMLPLHFAAQYANVDVVKCLVGAHPEALLVKTADGKLPVDMARRNAKQDVAAWLETATENYRSSPVAQSGTDSEPAVASGDPPPKDDAKVIDPHKVDRERLSKVTRRGVSAEPVVVRSAYVESILTRQVVGHGFFGTVYKGVDTKVKCKVAIKSINTDILRGGTEQDRAAAMKTFQREQEALSRFRHPNIAALLAYTDPLVEGAEGYYLVYELSEKGSLDTFLKDDVGRSRLGSFQRRVQIAVDVFTAVRFLHVGRGEVTSCFHRDIKSANIVLRRNFTAQLIDCGLAKFVRDGDDNLLTSTGIRGTPGYLCPEYAAGRIAYEAACDVFSFGVVLAELWTGRLQNSKDKSGSVFNFEKSYLLGTRGKRRDFLKDVDPAINAGNPLPDYMRRFADLSLRCMAHDTEDRWPGEKVLLELRSIIEACRNVEDPVVVEPSGPMAASTIPLPSEVPSTELCATCRTFPRTNSYDSCLMCVVGVAARTAISETVGTLVEPSLKRIRRQVKDVGRKIDSTLPVLALLDRRLNHQVPRLFLLVPADLKNGWKHPRSWLRSHVQKTYYVFFVCAVSHRAVSPPVKLRLTKDWVVKAAPVLATAIVLLQVSLKAGLNLSLDLDGTAHDLFELSSDHIREVAHELSSLLDEAGRPGLLDRLRSQHLTSQDVQDLNDDAYELIVEKAAEQRGWRSAMEPVRLPPSPQVFWVRKEAANDPTNEYEIVRS